MLAEGAQPRVELRIVRWSGLRYRMILESTGSAGLEGQPVLPGPTVTMTLENEVLQGSANPIEQRIDGGLLRMIEERSALADLSVRHEGSPKPIVDAWNAALVHLRGTASRQRVTEGAAIAWAGTELVGGVKPPDEIRRTLDGAFEAQRHFPFRLPPVAVGIGARWRFHEPLMVNGVRVVQVAEMSLRAIDANTATITVKIRQEASRQEVPHPFLPGQKASLDLYRNDGEGEVELDRTTAIPLHSRLTSMARLTLSDRAADVHRTLDATWTSIITARGSFMDEADAEP